MKKREGNQKGMAFLLALIAVLIISALIGGIMLLSVSHLALSSTNSDYASAMNLAEAGVNWEFNKVTNMDKPGALPLDNNVWSISQALTITNRTFRAKICGDEAGTIAWTPPNMAWIFGEGIVNGVRRTVRVKMIKGTGASGPEGPYALFGINNLDISGNLTVNGASGTNNEADMDAGGSYILNGDFYYCGIGDNPLPPDGIDPSHITGTIQPTALDEAFRTVNEIANQRVLEVYGDTTNAGINFFADKTYNDNDKIAWTDADPNSPYYGTINAFPKEFTDMTKYMKYKNIPNDVKKLAIVFGSGDYYFDSFDLNGNNLQIDSSGGPVNIWLGAEGATGSADKINGNIAISSGDVTKVHIYEGSQRTLWIQGTQPGAEPYKLEASIYAYNGNSTEGYYGTIQLTGNAGINGSVIGYNVDKAQGNVTVVLPSMGGGDPPPGGHYLFYTLVPDWTELNPL